MGEDFMLEIKDLTVYAGDKLIIDNLNLKINDGEIHALMGQNGTGKSTLCKVIMHDEAYTVKKGQILWHDKDLTKMATTDIAREKVFLLNQNPMAIEGVSNAEMLRMTLNEITGEQVGIFAFNKKLQEVCAKLNLPSSFIHREINVGMSGGERKKNELMHMWMLNPELILLDEIDSGLDVDAIKDVANSINEYYSLYKPTILIITHHEKILDLIKAQKVHIMKTGKIVATSNLSLAKKIENEGFNKTFDISGLDQNE